MDAKFISGISLKLGATLPASFYSNTFKKRDLLFDAH